ncbi:MAG: rod shape-determining protein MreD [Nitrospirae bacterium RBG_13_39_12]|nr:MAG: rod shape-determining protein MreD [Nitrospirae bacterium RBG_13_39_12]
MIYVIWAAIIFFIFIIQESVSLLDVTPDLTVILVCYAGIRKGEVKGIFLGSLIGIIEDSLSGTLLGPNLLSKGLVGYLSSLIYRKFFIWTPLIGIISVSALTLIDSSFVFILRSTFDRIPVSIGAALFSISIQSLLNAPWGVFLKPKLADIH